MATFVSYNGKLYPGWEEVSLKYEGDKEIPKEKLSKYVHITGDVLKKNMPYIYKGPDRSAMAMLKDQDVEYLGQDFRHNQDFRQMVRSLGFNTPEEYLDYIGFNEEAQKERFEKLIAKVDYHDLPEAEEDILIMGGGRSTAGEGKDLVGGYGDPEIKSKEQASIKLKKRATV